MNEAEAHPTPPGVRESWAPGDVAFFEYRCWEDDGSGDAYLWYRSHQMVTVTGRAEDENYGHTYAERMDAGMPNYYEIRFRDGQEGCAEEDELLRGPSYYERPDAPCYGPDPRSGRPGQTRTTRTENEEN
jgi:hypothetical protein